MENLQEYQSKHLFLLIGANPLPNYVALQLLRRSDGQVYLIHTAETSTIADRLVEVTGLVLGRNAIKIPVNDSSAVAMVEQIYRQAKGKSDLGLHYTGGTKRMALYAEHAISKAGGHYGLLPTLSYLDARTLALWVEREGANTHILPIGLTVQPSLETLLALHGYSVTALPDTPLAGAIVDLYPDLVRTDYLAFRRWWDRARRGMSGQMERIALPQDDGLAPLARHWRGLGTTGDLAEHWQTTPNELARWFTNLGLEDYTLWSLQQSAVETGVRYTAMNIQPRELSFEFDVIALRGYQLFALSCANSAKKDELKLKLFEAYVRARQMGGDEARVAVVCRVGESDPHATPAVIEAEIRNTWDSEGKIRVFGEAHLPALHWHLTQWLTGKKG